MGITDKLEQKERTIFPPISIFTNDAAERDLITFAGTTKNVCVGVVDIVSSTRIAARLTNQNISKYYSIFLNTLGAIIVKFQGRIVKNVGDSILYYFEDNSTESQFVRCLECSLSMLQIHDYLNMHLKSQGLPSLDYRISSDYGTVAIAKSQFMAEDIFGQPVNICAKINSLTKPNSLVIGSDFYEISKNLDCYKFEETVSFSSGLKNSYPVYTACHNDSKIRVIVAKCVENMLLQIGTPIFEEVTKRLYQKHNCFLYDCYNKPEYLKEVLSDLYGNAGNSITKSIESQIEEELLPKPVKEFLTYLKH